ncbi:GNAT family N-acetyltransferase [uncultured Megasphaera sp.]|uniref:GNAT family N-acetyltransferase n=1 Tax=uncultured Megasphaera sp. TaxID=165188 RepID=UPI0025FC80E0|nr:GNAT family N-acetyltransferase [uncultured Megasphaera sp.]
MELKYSENKIWIENEKGAVVGEVDFPEQPDGNYDIVHTFVDDSLRGQGAAAKLVKAAADEIRRRNKKTATSCTYAKAWFKRHKDEDDLLV